MCKLQRALKWAEKHRKWRHRYLHVWGYWKHVTEVAIVVRLRNKSGVFPSKTLERIYDIHVFCLLFKPHVDEFEFELIKIIMVIQSFCFVSRLGSGRGTYIVKLTNVWITKELSLGMENIAYSTVFVLIQLLVLFH